MTEEKAAVVAVAVGAVLEVLAELRQYPAHHRHLLRTLSMPHRQMQPLPLSMRSAKRVLWRGLLFQVWSVRFVTN